MTALYEIDKPRSGSGSGRNRVPKNNSYTAPKRDQMAAPKMQPRNDYGVSKSISNPAKNFAKGQGGLIVSVD